MRSGAAARAVGAPVVEEPVGAAAARPDIGAARTPRADWPRALPEIRSLYAGAVRRPRCRTGGRLPHRRRSPVPAARSIRHRHARSRRSTARSVPAPPRSSSAPAPPIQAVVAATAVEQVVAAEAVEVVRPALAAKHVALVGRRRIGRRRRSRSGPRCCRAGRPAASPPEIEADSRSICDARARAAIAAHSRTRRCRTARRRRRRLRARRRRRSRSGCRCRRARRSGRRGWCPPARRSLALVPVMVAMVLTPSSRAPAARAPR